MSQALNDFGRFVMENLRDAGLSHYDMLAAGSWKAPGLRRLQEEVAALTDAERAVVRRCVQDALDSAIHDFLFAVQEAHDAGKGISILMDGENVAGLSDGLHGEPFTSDGWQARFSKFGEALQDACPNRR